MNKKEQFEAFLAAVLPEITDEAQRKAVEEALRADAVVTKGADFVLRQNDYSKQSDALRAQSEKLAADRKALEEWYAESAPVVDKAVKDAKDAQAALAAYEAKYGKLDGAPPVSPEDITKRLAEELDKRDRAAFAVMDTLSDIKLEHAQRFKGERLDTNEILKVASERGLPLAEAYKSWIAPREKELHDKDVEDRIRKAREEGEAAALSKHNLPVAPATPGPSIFNMPTEGVIRNDFERQAAAAKNFVAALAKQT